MGHGDHGVRGRVWVPAPTANADVLIFSNTHNYDWNGNIDAVDILVQVFSTTGGTYLWQYTVTNNSYDPANGNGFSGFELALPVSPPPPDLVNITDPAIGTWEHDCCSGLPVEWDAPDGPGIGVGQSGVFSFETAPRSIVNSTGWFHTWSFGTQTDITNYTDTPGELGPEAPNLTIPGRIPEPASLMLLSAALLGFGVMYWRRRTV